MRRSRCGSIDAKTIRNDPSLAMFNGSAIVDRACDGKAHSARGRRGAAYRPVCVTIGKVGLGGPLGPSQSPTPAPAAQREVIPVFRFENDG